MKITRKQAILILLCGPAARPQINVAQTTNGETIVDAIPEEKPYEPT